jgi:hypothetical protein
MIYVNTFEPLCRNAAGRRAVDELRLPPFVDGSCRREPDLEHRFPSITAIRGGRTFAPRLKDGDTVVYLTKPGTYAGARSAHRRLVAVLEVTRRFCSHVEAARWYRAHGGPLPRNCMIEGNPPLPLEQTDRSCDSVLEWDQRYEQRVRTCGVFLVCLKVYAELSHPAVLTEEAMDSIFGRRTTTRGPRRISEDGYGALLLNTVPEQICKAVLLHTFRETVLAQAEKRTAKRRTSRLFAVPEDRVWMSGRDGFRWIRSRQRKPPPAR